MLEAAHGLAQQFPDLQLLFVGEGKEEGALQQLARTLQLEKRTHFLGYREDIPQIIAACDVFALPSFKEGLSIAVTEALALRRAVIATDIAGMPEVIRDGQTGLLVPPGDTPALQDALQTLLADSALRARLGAAGRAYLAQHFAQRASLSRCETLLREIAQAGFSGRVVADG